MRTGEDASPDDARDEADGEGRRRIDCQSSNRPVSTLQDIQTRQRTYQDMATERQRNVNAEPERRGTPILDLALCRVWRVPQAILGFTILEYGANAANGIHG